MKTVEVKLNFSYEVEDSKIQNVEADKRLWDGMKESFWKWAENKDEYRVPVSMEMTFEITDKKESKDEISSTELPGEVK